MRTTVSVAAVERASGLVQEVRGRTEEARERERARSTVRGGFGWASGREGTSQGMEANSQKRRRAAAEAVVEASAEEAAMWSAQSGGGGKEWGGRNAKGADGRSGLRGWVTGTPMSLNAAALALRGAQSVPLGMTGEGIALVAAANGGIARRSRWRGQDGEKQAATLGEQALAVAGGEISTAGGGRGGAGRRSDEGGGRASWLAQEVSWQTEEARGRERTGGTGGRG